MTTELEPIRWTESSDGAPELLRAPFAAATREGPSAAQMRMLALKLSAVAAGTAVVAGTATAQASATASSTLTGGIATGTALPFAKIVAVVAVVGATAWGGVSLLHQPAQPRAVTPVSTTAQQPQSRSAAQLQAPVLEAANPQLNNTQIAPAQARAETPEAAPRETLVPEPATRVGRPLTGNTQIAAGSRDQVRAPKGNAPQVSRVVSTKSNEAAQETHARNGKADVPSEVELLRRARTALAARPREAFSLTEQHREHYPRGMFSQEREAIAIEALLRAGDTDRARELAKKFVSAHPSSPHAHRFRETLGLR